MDYTKINNGIEKYRAKGKTDAEINAYLKSIGIYAPTLNKIDTQYKPQGFLGKTAEFLSAPSRALIERGKGIFSDTSQLESTQQNLQADLQRYEQTIAKWKYAGKDTTQLEKNVNSLKYEMGGLGANIENIKTGGVTNKQVGASAFQTGLSFLPSATGLAGKALQGSKIPLAAKAGKTLSSIDAMAGTKPYKYSMVEGGLVGAGFGGSQAYGEGGGAGDIAQGTILGGTTGVALGPVFTYGLKLALKPIEKTASAITGKKGIFQLRGKPTIQQIQEKAQNAFDFESMTSKEILRELGGDPSESMPLNLAESMFNRSVDYKGDPFIPVFSKGKQKIFDTKNFDSKTFFQAFDKSREDIYNDASSIISELGSKDWGMIKNNITSKLLKYSQKAGFDDRFRSRAAQMINELNKKMSPAEVEEFIGTTLNSKVDKFFSSNSDSLENRLAMITKKFIRDEIYGYASKFDGGEQLQSLMKELRPYQALEKQIEGFVKKQKNPDLSLLLDELGSSNIISGLSFGNSAQATKGGAYSGIKFLESLIGDTNINSLKKAFQMFDDYYAEAGVKRGVTRPDFNKLKASIIGKTTTDIVPVGEVVPENTIRMRPPIRDEAVVPKPPIRQAEETIRATKLLPGQGEGPFGYKGEGMPVAPAGQEGFELTSKEGIGKYIPRTKEELEQMPPEELKQLILDFLGGKKKIDSEGGSITGAILTLLSGITGSATLAQWAENTKPTVVINEDSPVKKTPTEFVYKDDKRGEIKIQQSELEAIKPILFGEVSNRSSEKKELEIRVILNTILNRYAEYQRLGIPKTIQQIAEDPAIYQAYNGKQYNKYVSGELDELGKQKKQEVDQLIEKVYNELRQGTLKDNTNQAFYYIHNSDGSITFDDKKRLWGDRDLRNK